MKLHLDFNNQGFCEDTNMQLKTFHLTKLFRQSDIQEGNILSRIRVASQTDADLVEINKNVVKGIPDGATVLCLFRRTAQAINNKALEKISAAPLEFWATRTGTYNDKWDDGKYKQQGPYLETLHLKLGCRVIIKQNGDFQFEGRKIEYRNGDSGILLGLDKQDRLLIRRTDDELIKLKKHKVGDIAEKRVEEWVEEEGEDGKPKMVKITKLVEHSKGSFTQYPITLGYAQTGHSSQGLTLDRVHIMLPVGKPFAPNMIYVMMSRVRSMKKLTFNRPLTHEDVWVIDGLNNKGQQQYDLL